MEHTIRVKKKQETIFLKEEAGIADGFWKELREELRRIVAFRRAS